MLFYSPFDIIGFRLLLSLYHVPHQKLILLIIIRSHQQNKLHIYIEKGKKKILVSLIASPYCSYSFRSVLLTYRSLWSFIHQCPSYSFSYKARPLTSTCRTKIISCFVRLNFWLVFFKYPHRLRQMYRKIIFTEKGLCLCKLFYKDFMFCFLFFSGHNV